MGIRRVLHHIRWVQQGHGLEAEKTDYPWSSIGGFGAYSIASAYGMVFRGAYNYIYAFNWTDGKIVWKYEAPTYAPFETPYIDTNGTEVYSFNAGCTIADGKMYLYNTEHTPTWPLTRGWGIHCINITDGTLLWKLDNPMTGWRYRRRLLRSLATAGTGTCTSSARAKAPQQSPHQTLAVPLGTGVLIKGTVLDQSPAQPNTPCVSKDSMSQQMEYLHLQQPIGGLWNNVTIIGVPVSLTAIDSNGTVIRLRHSHKQRLLRRLQSCVDSANRRQIRDHRFVRGRRLLWQLNVNNHCFSGPSASSISRTNRTHTAN